MTSASSGLGGADRGTLLEVGRITRPHGVRGEIKVQLFWSDSDALFVADQVLVRHEDGRERWWQLTSARPANRFVLVRLATVDTRDSAAELSGGLVLVSRSALPPLKPGEYYLVDLIGARVECRNQPVGVVVEIRPYATVDALVVETPDGRRVEQPVLDHWIERVDVEGQLVSLASTDGLIE